jgi:hypothetical protein
MDWFKTYQDGILRGSLSDTDHVTQLIWIKLLAIENETRQRDGWLHYQVGKPMSREYIAMVCGVTPKQLNDALEQYLGDRDKDGHSRIEIAADGDIFIKNWDKYQSKPEKLIAKEIAIAKAKETKSRNNTVIDRCMELVNKLNEKSQEYKFQVMDDGRVLNKKTGVIVTMSDLEGLDKIF